MDSEAWKTLQVRLKNLGIYEQDLMKLKTGQTVNFTLTNLPGKEYKAKIFSIGNAFENETKTIAVHASIPGDKTGLIEGMNVTAWINISKTFSPAVPSAAITRSAGNDYIFVQTEEKDTVSKETFAFERIQVKTGVTDNGFTEITPLEKISENAKVVINGAFYLLSMLTNEGEKE